MQVAAAELVGWTRNADGLWDLPPCCGCDNPPNYHTNLGTSADLRATIAPDDYKSKGAYMNALRKIVGRRLPPNSKGASIVSDYDCVDATAEEHLEAFLIMKGVMK